MTRPTDVSPRAVLVSLYEAILQGQEFAEHTPPGATPQEFDVREEFPDRPTDFAGNRGRVVLSGPLPSNLSPTDPLSAFQYRASAFAHGRSDAAYLGEHVARLVQGLGSRGLRMPGQCAHSVFVNSIAGPVMDNQSELHYSVVTFTVWLKSA